MPGKPMSLPIRPRSVAEQDVANHAEYIQWDSLDAALRFLDAVDAVFSRLIIFGDEE